MEGIPLKSIQIPILVERPTNVITVQVNNSGVINLQSWNFVHRNVTNIALLGSLIHSTYGYEANTTKKSTKNSNLKVEKQGDVLNFNDLSDDD